MGICNPKEPKIIKDNSPTHQKQTIKVEDIQQLKSIKFQFTSQMLIHIKADLLILFMDHTTNVKRNQHFTKLPLQGGKVQDHANAYIQKNKLGIIHGKQQLPHITFNIIIPTLNFNKIGLIFCNPWRKDGHNQTQFAKQLNSYFTSIKEEKLQSIAIAQFTSQLGIHLQKGVRRILHELATTKNRPQIVQFICFTQQSKALYMETVNNSSQDIKKSFQSESSLAQSNYY